MRREGEYNQFKFILSSRQWLLTLFGIFLIIFCLNPIRHSELHTALSVLNTQQIEPTTSSSSTVKRYGINAPNENGDRLLFDLALNQSYGFFDDITNENWKLLQKIAVEHVNHKYPDQPLTHNPAFDRRKAKYFNSAPAWWQTNYEPNFSCQFEKRIGRNPNGDGPKWVCDPHRIKKMAKKRKESDPNHPGCVIYSIGSNGDFNFELGMQDEVGAEVCEFHIFDMGDYESRVPKELKRAYYHQWGLSKQKPNAGIPAANQTFYGLMDTIKLLGHEKLDVIDVFKIDCEKCEWNTFQDWLADGIPRLHQIQVEVHNAPPVAIQFFNMLEKAGYLRFHKEPNIQFNDGSCVEYALIKVHEKFLEGKNITK